MADNWPITQRSLILSVSSVAVVQTGLASHGATATMASDAGLFYSTTGRAVRQSWGAAAVADTPSKHARATASDPKMRFGTDVFVIPRGPSYANAMRGTSVRTRTAGS